MICPMLFTPFANVESVGDMAFNVVKAPLTKLKP
jgi:hypothetical protein